MGGEQVVCGCGVVHDGGGLEVPRRRRPALPVIGLVGALAAAAYTWAWVAIGKHAAPDVPAAAVVLADDGATHSPTPPAGPDLAPSAGSGATAGAA